MCWAKDYLAPPPPVKKEDDREGLEDLHKKLQQLEASIDRLRGQVRTVTDTEDDLSERLQDCGSTQGTFSRGEEENTNYGSCENSDRNTTSSETQHIQTSTDRSQGDKSQSVEIVLDTQPATHSRVHRDPPGFEGCKGTGAFVKDRVTEWVNYDTENATGDELPDLETGLEEEEENQFDEYDKHVEESTSRDEEQDTGFAKSSSRSCSVGSNQSSTNYHNFGATQTRDIRNSWSLILTRLQKVGVQCIVDLFELHPFVREHFTQIILNYGGLDPEDKNVMQGILENHAKLIMNIVHEVVMNIDDLDVMDAKLSRLGFFHFKNGIPERYLDIMGPIFCNAMRPILLQADRWTNAVEEAWMEVFKAITYFMKKSYQTEDDIPKEMFLVPTEKCIIVATWHSIFLKHMINMGKTLFVDMFRVEPNILKYFDAFKDNGINNLSMNRAFQSHGLRVMNLVKFVVENIENPGKLQNHMTILGKMHVKKGINQKYLDLMGPTFCQAIRPMVMAEGQWSIDIESAWARLFKMLVLMMSRAYTEKEVDRAVSFPNPRQTELILRSWQEIQQSLEEIGQEAFRKLFEAHSDIQDYFPAMKKLSSNDVEMSRHIKEHSTRIMDVIRMFVSNIHHLDRVLPRIENLGHEHYKSGVKSEYLDVMGPIFTHCVRPCLVRKDMWSLQIEEVWLLLIKKIAETMKKGFPKERRKTYRFLK